MSDFNIEDYRLKVCLRCGMHGCNDGVNCTPSDVDYNAVAHPRHYTIGKIECIDFIIDKQLNFNLGNAVKYIVRCNHKDNKKQDLEKAIQYLRFELEKNT